MKKIKLTQGKYAMVDDEDYFILKDIGWCAKKGKHGFYAHAWRNKGVITMHKFLINPPNGFQVDHKDGNGLNNQRINLRVATGQMNQANQRLSKANTLGFKGVAKGHYIDKYISHIRVNKKLIHLGVFQTKEEAAKIYDEAAVRYFGEFARTNKMMGLLN